MPAAELFWLATVTDGRSLCIMRRTTGCTVCVVVHLQVSQAQDGRADSGMFATAETVQARLHPALTTGLVTCAQAHSWMSLREHSPVADKAEVSYCQALSLPGSH